eukprot:CAMPEP_0185189650 /NCGR_PEP_ID=MMETSP1140-20130426/6171_1 /TAXON_ID=298111 /ORGANISM="Pavlova sp., Strain CCMP459" /LENGTH=146 /DNA_ID=CAMNT_0027756229 /DNA_START=41 /DNA_END=481 /DNA_ORIENTATION=+
MSVSPDLVWACVRNNSSFIRGVRKPCASFTTEPGNLTGRNAFKYSGLANKKTLDVRANGDKLKLTMKVKGIDAVAHKPKASTRTCALAKPSMRAVAKSMKRVTSDTFYRADLTQAALAKASCLKAAQSRAAAGVSKKEKSKRNTRK